MSTGVTIATAIIGSSAVAGLIQFFVSRHDSKMDMIKKIADDLRELRDDFHLSRAIAARIRIISASDEVMHGVRHSQEWWDQILDDCTFYEQYCAEHPTFKNKKAVHAEKHLNDVYAKIYEKNDFI